MALLRSTFISLSRNRPLRRFSEGSHLGRRLSSRFVAGTRTDEVLAAAAALNQQGIAVTLDSLGENVHSEQEALRSAAIYHELLDAIQQRRLNGNISVKLSQMGMELDPAIAERIVRDLTGHARATGNFVRIDMEGSAYTQRTLDLFEQRLYPTYRENVGIVLQSYLYRTFADVQRAIAIKARVRLCKGAYKEPETVAYPDKKEVDANYVRCLHELLEHGNYPGIATHDEAIIRNAKNFVKEKQIPLNRFEFQMLYGVRRDLQDRLVREGYRMRVYVPFGTQWYPYLMRRLAERPANVAFITGNVLKEMVARRKG